MYDHEFLHERDHLILRDASLVIKGVRVNNRKKRGQSLLRFRIIGALHEKKVGVYFEVLGRDLYTYVHVHTHAYASTRVRAGISIINLCKTYVFTFVNVSACANA